jgi:hypothetical protein
MSAEERLHMNLEALEDVQPRPTDSLGSFLQQVVDTATKKFGKPTKVPAKPRGSGMFTIGGSHDLATGVTIIPDTGSGVPDPRNMKREDPSGWSITAVADVLEKRTERD